MARAGTPPMIVNGRRKFIFIANPRTASHSMRIALTEIPGSISLQHHRRNTKRRWRGYFTFACARNPYAREYSLYCYRLMRPKVQDVSCAAAHELSFGEYIDWLVEGNGVDLDGPQATFLGGLRLDALLRFEALPHCFNALPFVERKNRLPHVNQAVKGDWREAYDPELADKVFAYASQDFELYGYHRESWRPVIELAREDPAAASTG